MKEKRKLKYPLIITIIIFGLFLSIFAQNTQAISIFTPFGGKVKRYNPTPSACISLITTPVSIATLGIINITIEEVVIGPPTDTTIGILRVNGFTLPFLTTIYKHKSYQIPNSWVLGNTVNVCDICGGITEDISLADKICKIKAIKKFTEFACKALSSSSCPITNIVHKIGVGLPTN